MIYEYAVLLDFFSLWQYRTVFLCDCSFLGVYVHTFT